MRSVFYLAPLGRLDFIGGTAPKAGYLALAGRICRFPKHHFIAIVQCINPEKRQMDSRILQEPLHSLPVSFANPFEHPFDGRTRQEVGEGFFVGDGSDFLDE